MPSPEQQIKEGFDKINTEFEGFKKENNTRLKLIEDKGFAPADYEEKVNKQNEAIDKLIIITGDLQKAINRAPSQVDPESKNEVEKKMSKVMSTWMRRGDQRISAEDLKFYEDNIPKEFKGLIVGNDNEGGYFVTPQMGTEIIKKLFETSPMRQLSNSITIGTNAYEELFDDDEPDASWAGEIESVSETDENKINKLRIPTHEQRANPRASQQIIEDASINIEQWHAGKVVEKFNRAENTAFVSGNGVGRPKGILAYASGNSFGNLERVNNGSTSALKADGLISLQYTLFESFQGNATWLMQRASAQAVRKLVDGQGRYLWAPNGNLIDGGVQGILLGRPLLWASDMNAATNGLLPVAYGDFKMGYLIVDRLGISVLRDPYSAKPHVEFYTRKRVGGAVRQYQAIKLLVMSA